MKITFIGAAHQVTGSCTLVEWMDNRYFLVDYGMEQGENDFVMQELPVAPGQIEYVFLTHAHIDHSGMLPLLYKRGFRGTIYATAETENLCSIMLADSAHIQETDAAYETKKNLRHSGTVVEPLYTSEDVAETMDLFKPCEYGEIYMVDEGLSARFTDAGHLLGSSFVELFLEDRGETRKLVCTGDVGNLEQPIINNPQPVKEADYLLIESTYGTRIHEFVTPPIPALTEILRETFSRGGSVIIPSFAVGRTQELLYFFREIKQNHLIPEYDSFPVYVDSPNVSLSGNGFRFPVGSECTVWVEVDCIGKENLLSLDSLAVTFGNSNVVYRTVQDERMQGATIYYVYCTCNEEGSFDLTVSVGGASYTTKVVVYNK